MKEERNEAKYRLTGSSYLQATSARLLLSPNRLRSSSLGPVEKEIERQI